MLIPQAYAQCPVCVLTVGGGLFIAKKLGVDDLIAAIWISGLNTALAHWFAVHIKKPPILKQPLFLTLVMVILTGIYLFITGQLFHVNNTFLGVDKGIAGLLLGSAFWILGIRADSLLRSHTHGKRLFPYQKVLIPFVFLLLLTLFVSIFVAK